MTNATRFSASPTLHSFSLPRLVPRARSLLPPREREHACEWALQTSTLVKGSEGCGATFVGGGRVTSSLFQRTPLQRIPHLRIPPSTSEIPPAPLAVVHALRASKHVGRLIQIGTPSCRITLMRRNLVEVRVNRR